jgi:hypothetical protein
VANAVVPLNPVTGEKVLVDVRATLGGRKPFSDELTSNLAEAFGDVVPIPVCAFTLKANATKNKKYIATFFMNLLVQLCF